MIVKIRRLIRLLVIGVRNFIYTKIYKMDIHKSARVSFGAKLDKTNPQGVHIGEESYIASGVLIFAHDYARDIKKMDTYIGKRCFIGANVIVMPGVTIEDEVVVGAGSIVTKNIAANSIAAGNPAKILQTGITTKKFGQINKTVEQK